MDVTTILVITGAVLVLAAAAFVYARRRGRVPVLVFVNNHFAGYAHETIEQLRRAMRRA